MCFITFGTHMTIAQNHGIFMISGSFQGISGHIYDGPGLMIPNFIFLILKISLFDQNFDEIIIFEISWFSMKKVTKYRPILLFLGVQKWDFGQKGLKMTPDSAPLVRISKTLGSKTQNVHFFGVYYFLSVFPGLRSWFPGYPLVPLFELSLMILVAILSLFLIMGFPGCYFGHFGSF